MAATYISPVDIREFVICPHRLLLQKKHHPEFFPKPGEFTRNQHNYFKREPGSTTDIIFATLRDVIKILFVLDIKRERKHIVRWNSVRTCIGHAMTFRAKMGLEIPTDATRLVELTHSFYQHHFVKRFTNIPVYTNFPILLPLGKGKIYADLLHGLGKSEDGWILVDFRLMPRASSVYTIEDFKKDSLLAARLWGLKKLTGEAPHCITVFYIGMNEGTKVRVFNFFPSNIDIQYTTQQITNINYVIQGIEQEVSYASRRPDCEYCLYKDECLMLS